MSHISAIELLAAQLKDLNEPVTEAQVMTKILVTLPPSFRHFLSVWDNVSVKNRNIQTLTQRLLKEENVTKIYNNGQSDPADSAFFSNNFPTQQGDRNTRGGHNNRRGRGRFSRPVGTTSRHPYIRKCNYCGDTTHLYATCRNRLRNERKGETGAVAETSNLASDDNNNHGDHSYHSSTQQTIRNDSIWYADSGATRHMTDQRNILWDFKPDSSTPRYVTGIGGTQLLTAGQGDIRATTTIDGAEASLIIKGVLFVPKLGTNLFSIGASTNEGVKVVFTNNEARFYRNGNLELVGKRTDNTLYRLNITAKVADEDSALSANLILPLSTWHERLAHVSNNNILKMANQKLVVGLNLSPNHSDSKVPCIGCTLGKMHRSSLPQGRTRGTHIGSLIHSDVCGPITPPSPSGSRYFVTFKDDYSNWTIVHFLKNKDEVPDLFRAYTVYLKNSTGGIVKTLRSDNGGEYTSKNFSTWLRNSGIRHETSAPHTPAQNGVAERANRTIVEAARSLIYTRSIPLKLWAEAVAYAVYTLNRVLSKSTIATPFEMWFHKKPDISYLRIFGARTFVHTPDANRKKLDPKSQEGIFVGYCDASKAFRVWIHEKQRVVISRDVLIDENNIFKGPSSEERHILIFPESNFSEETTDGSPTPDVETPHLPAEPGTELSTQDPESAEKNTEFEENAEDEQIYGGENIPEGEQNTEQTEENSASVQLRRSNRQPIYSEKFKDWRRNLGLLSCNSQPHEPLTYNEAVMSDVAHLWRPAIDDEYASLMKNETWVLTPLPPGRTAIKAKWIFKVKPGHKDVPARYKARLVAKGYTQSHGLDYQDTYAPVVKHSSLRTILSLVAAMDLEITQLDIKTAFLYGELEEELYLEQPEGFITAGREKEVCRLKKSLYGLKQAPRAWNTKFNEFLLKFGLTRCDSDSCVYYRRQEEGEIIIVCIFVDDGLICTNTKTVSTAILCHLNTHFDIRSLPADRFVGLDILRDRPNRKLYVSQLDFVNKILKKFNLDLCQPKSIPADPNARLTASMSPNTSPDSTNPLSTRYREAIGCLMYVMTMTRPDIAFAVGQESQFCQNPGDGHWNGVKRIFAYLAGSAHLGLCFDGQQKNNLIGFSDSDFAGNMDNRRSTSGFVFLYNGAPVSWSSKLQQCVSLSTTEAEFVAASETSKEAIWLQQLLKEVKGDDIGSVPLLCDNQGAIRLIKNPEFHQRTKHIAVKYHFVRHQQLNGNIEVSYVSTENQLADILTKPLPGPRFILLRNQIGVKPLPQNPTV
jgi:transposase InsO family protein